MLRRTKQEVLKELPPKRRLVMTIDSDEGVYRRLMEPVNQTLRLMRETADANASQRALWEMEVERGERQATGVAKAPRRGPVRPGAAGGRAKRCCSSPITTR